MKDDIIYDLLPQRSPFLFVDSISSTETNNKATCYHKFDKTNPIFKGHFPNNPIVPGVLLIEMMAQATLACIKINSLSSSKNKNVYLTNIEKAKFKKTVIPPDTVKVEVEIIRTIRNFVISKCKAFTNETTIVAEAEIIAYTK